MNAMNCCDYRYSFLKRLILPLGLMSLCWSFTTSAMDAMPVVITSSDNSVLVTSGLSSDQVAGVQEVGASKNQTLVVPIGLQIGQTVHDIDPANSFSTNGINFGTVATRRYYGEQLDVYMTLDFGPCQRPSGRYPGVSVDKDILKYLPPLPEGHRYIDYRLDVVIDVDGNQNTGYNWSRIKGVEYIFLMSNLAESITDCATLLGMPAALAEVKDNYATRVGDLYVSFYNPFTLPYNPVINPDDGLAYDLELSQRVPGLSAQSRVYFQSGKTFLKNGSVAREYDYVPNWVADLLAAGLTSAGTVYYTEDLRTWINIPGQLAQLQIGDFNGDGKADLAGIASNGSVWYTTNLSTWVNVPGSLAQLRVGDFNGDGKADLAGLASDGSIWYTTNLNTWTRVPGGLTQLRVGDFNGDGKADLAGLASDGSIWYTTDLSAWTQVPGGLAQLQVGDLNGDGKADLAGLASDGSIWYTTNLSAWTQVPGGLAQLRVGDLNGDGKADLVGLANNGSIWYTTDLSTCTQIPGALSRLVVRHLNSDSKADLIGLGSDGSIWYTTNLTAWSNSPGQLYRLAGDD